MKIIPAIDIMKGSVVRLEQGDFDSKKVYSDDPVRVAGEWKAEGADILHVVDLDGAREGRPVNLDVASAVSRQVKIDLEFGGGLRSADDIDMALKNGVRFAVVGTKAVTDVKFCSEIIERFRERIIFAVDVKDGMVRIKGWEDVSQVGIFDYVKKLESLGAKRIIYTDISRDGMMKGPNLDGLRSLVRSTSVEVIASGGVSTIEDIKALKKLENGAIYGVIVGKALYEGKIKLGEAMRAG